LRVIQKIASQVAADVLKGAGVEISTDGNGWWIDNVFMERLWRSVKYERVYLKAYKTLAEARAEIGTYFEFYNSERRHQSLNRQRLISFIWMIYNVRRQHDQASTGKGRIYL